MLVFGMVCIISAMRSSAQDAATTNAADRSGQAQSDQGGTSRDLGKLDDRTRRGTIRASQLIGTNIQNDQDESVGEVKDLVIDANNGRVRYVAVTYGGFLGVGSKMFAVPFEAFHVRKKDTNDDDYVLVLNVTKEQLDGAEGFDNDRWPNFADQKVTSELNRRYNVDRNRMRDRNSNRSGAANRQADRSQNNPSGTQNQR